MNITMNLYTKRERNILEAGVTPEVLAAGDINIDPLKVKVAELFPQDEWDVWYFRCSAVLNAIKELSAYQNAPYMGIWRWYVPRTPFYLYYGSDDTKTHIRTVATPARLDSYLETIVDRPHSELASIVSVLSQVKHDAILDIDMKIADNRRHYWELTWTCARYENINVVYIKRQGN
ncbi:hypothetical protein pEaSNUABM29_00024 [Erwinia phage pEa_SNUABM_29]|nr:hypothetical protein pEaSNUABM29_00024 [Erwinia phage pEa_SNUABM_29]